MNELYSIKEIRESKLIYDRKPPAFGWIMTILTLLFVAGAFVWAGLSTKTYVVRASGIFADEARINVMNTVAGKINSIRVSEGQRVSQGDLLMEIDSYQMELQIAQLQSLVDLNDRQAKDAYRLISFVNGYLLDDAETQENPFEPDNAETALCFANAEVFLSYVRQYRDSATEENPFTQENLDNIKTQLLIQLSAYNNLEQYLSEKAKQQSQLDMYCDSLTEYQIRAKEDGVVHLTAGLTQGTVLSQGIVLATISSGQDDSLYLDVAVSAAERSKIAVGNAVEIAVSGVSQTEYGVVKGSVQQIDIDATQTEDGQVFYRLKIALDETEMTDKRGHTVKLTTGMIGECRIKYEETIWLRWVWEQIAGKVR